MPWLEGSRGGLCCQRRLPGEQSDNSKCFQVYGGACRIGALALLLAACNSGALSGPQGGQVDAGGPVYTSSPGDTGSGPACRGVDGGVACGAHCCQGQQRCLAQQCVTPGAICASVGDCAQDEYCELLLGDSVAASAPAESCFAPSPRQGRCLPRPVSGCSGPRCAELCEYRPPTQDTLSPIVEWHWGSAEVEFSDSVDVWSTPVVGRLHDANCDGRIDRLDPPAVVFLSGNSMDGQCVPNLTCRNGVLRAIDGASGRAIWSLRAAQSGSQGFAAGISPALGDLDRDGRLEIVAVTGEAHLVVVDGNGRVQQLSDQPIDGTEPKEGDKDRFGWGGALSLADADGDGFAEIAYGRTMFTMRGGVLRRAFVGTGGWGGAMQRAISFFADVDLASDKHLELLAGNTAYRLDGSVLWHNAALPDGFNAVADFDADGRPEVVLVADNQVWLLRGGDGSVLAGPLTLPGISANNKKIRGGPPTVADFDGDGRPEIGVATQTVYAVSEYDGATGGLSLLWSAPNHDISSSVTGSTVFDFEGDGRAEVVYNDECFLWVYSGTNGSVKFATPTTSFTATESSLVADIDGDGRAEMLMVANGADPSESGWKCDVAPWNQADPAHNRPAWTPPRGATAYRGLYAYGDPRDAWVGTRTLWSQHAYHVTNICSDRDSACNQGSAYGEIPREQLLNWRLPWLNNFRQNVQDAGLFDAPDATVTLDDTCSNKLRLRATLRNVGSALLRKGVEVAFSLRRAGATGEEPLGVMTSAEALWPGQSLILTYAPDAGLDISADDAFVVRILNDPAAPKFAECRMDNNLARAQRCVVQ